MDKKTSELLRKYLKNNEGVEKKAYEDKLGIKTIGIGYNLTQRNAKSHIKQIGANWENITNNGGELTDKQVLDLFEITINQFQAKILAIFPEFNKFSNVRQICLFDLLFNLGPSRLKRFKNFVSAVNSNNWSHAEIELINSKYAKQLPNRSKRNAEALRSNVLPKILRPKPKPQERKPRKKPDRNERPRHEPTDRPKPEPRDRPKPEPRDRPKPEPRDRPKPEPTKPDGPVGPGPLG
ncbi:glycoside hydrolase family protein [Algibacter sp. AS12]|uniref:glycoside hydrolase family protein n=1 Tax=Algibacter sp. AS12 TaxID=3135773 RepID=UPI00398B6E71